MRRSTAQDAGFGAIQPSSLGYRRSLYLDFAGDGLIKQDYYSYRGDNKV
jgi:hypothetical protein